MTDFTLDAYRALLTALRLHKDHRIRHDVDARPSFSLRLAQIEAEMGAKSTYYFRSMHFASHADTIRTISSLGHAIGYHYECLTTCKGDVDAAYRDFVLNLSRLRTLAPVSTACAHGSPTSPWDSSTIWLHHDIHSLGISFEPMLDTDFSRTLYLTDTGRCWDGSKVSLRDKVPYYQALWASEGLVFHSTSDIISALQNPSSPIHSRALMLNAHPQRWMPFGAQWMAEYVVQKSKNIAKLILVCTKSSR